MEKCLKPKKEEQCRFYMQRENKNDHRTADRRWRDDAGPTHYDTRFRMSTFYESFANTNQTSKTRHTIQTWRMGLKLGRWRKIILDDQVIKTLQKKIQRQHRQTQIHTVCYTISYNNTKTDSLHYFALIKVNKNKKLRLVTTKTIRTNWS